MPGCAVDVAVRLRLGDASHGQPKGASGLKKLRPGYKGRPSTALMAAARLPLEAKASLPMLELLLVSVRTMVHLLRILIVSFMFLPSFLPTFFSINNCY